MYGACSFWQCGLVPYVPNPAVASDLLFNVIFKRVLILTSHFYIHMKHNLFRNCYGIKTKKLDVTLNHTYSLDDVLSIHNHNFHYHFHLMYIPMNSK
jgi:hypothetical protein